MGRRSCLCLKGNKFPNFEILDDNSPTLGPKCQVQKCSQPAYRDKADRGSII